MAAPNDSGIDGVKRPLLERLGLVRGAFDPRFAWVVVACVVAIYVASFAVFYPRGATNHDEANYIRQTRMVLEGRSSVIQEDPFTGVEKTVVLSTYPLGAPLLMAPFAAPFGWRGIFAGACASAVAAILLTAWWIRSEDRSPAFALLLLGFPAVLVLGRVVTSDVPSAAWVALGLGLFWRGLDRGPGWGLASGFVAGASWALRASNPILFAPLFAGAVLRREWKAWALVVGGVAGLAARLASQYWFFGDALHERSAYTFAPETLGERLPLYLLGTLVFVPGGLALSLLYRGRRRLEVVITIALFFTLYLFQTYSSVESGFVKRIVLALRYLVPLLPLMAFAMAESVPRLWQAWLDRSAPRRRATLVRIGTAAVLAWLVGLASVAAAVHPVFDRWSATQLDIREAVAEYVPNDAVLVTNHFETKKFIAEMDRRFESVNTWKESPALVSRLLERHDRVYLMFVDRDDSETRRMTTQMNADFLAGIAEPTELLVDCRPTATDRLRIWRVTRGGATG